MAIRGRTDLPGCCGSNAALCAMEEKEANWDVGLKIQPPVAAVRRTDGDCGMKREP